MSQNKESINLPLIKPQHLTLTDATSDALQDAIRNGVFPPGSKLLPEIELMQMLGVSRTTLREALKRLEEQGLIVRRRGLGTYVCEHSILKDLSVNFGITDMIKEAGLQPASLAFEIRCETPETDVAEALALSSTSKVIVVDRVRTANEHPVVWSLDIFSEDLLGDRRIELDHLENESVYSYLYNELQIRVVRGVAQLIPVTANTKIVEKLNVRRGAPILRIDQTDYNVQDRPVLFSREYHLSDAFVFLINRKGPHR